MLQFILGLIIGAVLGLVTGGIVFFGIYAICVADKEECHTIYVNKGAEDSDGTST